MAQHPRGAGKLIWVIQPRQSGCLAMALVAGLGGSPTALAASGADCAGLSREALSVVLEAEDRTVSELTLKTGDRLSFVFETAAAGPFGSLALVNSASTPRSLLLGPAGTSVEFTARKSGVHAFEFAKEGPEPATFSVSCALAGTGPARATAAAGPRGFRAARLLGGSVEDLQPADMDDPAGIALDATALPPRAPGLGALVTASRPLNVIVLPPSDVNVRMGWRGEQAHPADQSGIGQREPSGMEAAVNYKPMPEIMVGALAQLEEPGGATMGGPTPLSEHGWMAGPVAAIKFGPGLSLDARAAWGVAEAAADPFGAHTISTPRREVSARLTNTQSYGPWWLAPSISVHHLQETGLVISSDPGQPAMSHTASSGRVEIGPEIAYRIDVDKSVFVEPRAAIGSFWDIESLSKLAPGEAGHGDMRLKAEAGVTVGEVDGARVQAGAAVEEGAQGAENVWSGRLQLSVPIK